MADKKKREIPNTEEDGPALSHEDIMKQKSPEAGARYEALLNELEQRAKSIKPKKD